MDVILHLTIDLDLPDDAYANTCNDIHERARDFVYTLFQDCIIRTTECATFTITLIPEL